ncbi:hypothetical protein AAFP35_08370 [Gordonia sp. CPCC 206044]|uniref:hypothetical protein n=1 Tax=Gordonia sp. CPCC 206044 TaxID=3140793 RepID=UPI003AF3BC36
MVETGTGNRGADQDGRPPERQRFRKLAQAALNADVTVEQVEVILADLGDVLVDMNKTIGGLDGAIDNLGDTMSRLTGTLDQVDATVIAMGDVVGRLERVVGRVEALVALGESAFRPLGVLESFGRGVATRLNLLR